MQNRYYFSIQWSLGKGEYRYFTIIFTCNMLFFFFLTWFTFAAIRLNAKRSILRHHGFSTLLLLPIYLQNYRRGSYRIARVLQHLCYSAHAHARWWIYYSAFVGRMISPRCLNESFLQNTKCHSISAYVCNSSILTTRSPRLSLFCVIGNQRYIVRWHDTWWTWYMIHV